MYAKSSILSFLSCPFSSIAESGLASCWNRDIPRNKLEVKVLASLAVLVSDGPYLIEL